MRLGGTRRRAGLRFLVFGRAILFREFSKLRKYPIPSVFTRQKSCFSHSYKKREKKTWIKSAGEKQFKALAVNCGRSLENSRNKIGFLLKILITAFLKSI